MINVDIVWGILGSGKTTFINSLKDRENILVIQREEGKVKLDKDYKVVFLKEFSDENIREAIKKYSPKKIIIEANGMESLSKSIEIFNEGYLKKLCNIRKIYSIIDSCNFNLYYRNFNTVIRDALRNSDVIIINLKKEEKREELSFIRDKIKEDNSYGKIFERDLKNGDSLKYIFEDKERKRISEGSFNFIVKVLALILLLLVLYVIYLSNKSIIDLQYFYSFSIKFLSIIIETLPFLLIGAFISALIQNVISDGFLIKLFPKNKLLSSISAAILGLFFPLCDCGIAPVAKGLIKKGVPVSSAITFLLSAPIVNPMAILATYYAFSGNAKISILRITLGLLIAIIVGIIVGEKEPYNILEENYRECDCLICNAVKGGGKIRNLFKYSSNEFFYIGRYAIIGAFFGSVFQVLPIKQEFLSIINDSIGGFIIILVFSAIFSVCTISDPFMASGIIKNFSVMPIVIFLILGPMVSIKNVMILMGSFKRKFVFEMIFTIIIVTLIIFSLGILI